MKAYISPNASFYGRQTVNKVNKVIDVCSKGPLTGTRIRYIFYKAFEKTLVLSLQEMLIEVAIYEFSNYWKSCQMLVLPTIVLRQVFNC